MRPDDSIRVDRCINAAYGFVQRFDSGCALLN